jgi:hypothetical protein
MEHISFFQNYIRKFLGRYAKSVSSVSARDRAQGTGVLHGMWFLPAHRSPAMWMTPIGHKPNDLNTVLDITSTSLPSPFPRF